MKTFTVPADEYQWLYKLYLASLDVRDRGLREFNRLSPPMRLAIVSLAAHYREQGLGDSGAMPATYSSAIKPADRPVSANTEHELAQREPNRTTGAKP